MAQYIAVRLFQYAGGGYLVWPNDGRSHEDGDFVANATIIEAHVPEKVVEARIVNENTYGTSHMREEDEEAMEFALSWYLRQEFPRHRLTGVQQV